MPCLDGLPAYWSCVVAGGGRSFVVTFFFLLFILDLKCRMRLTLGLFKNSLSFTKPQRANGTILRLGGLTKLLR